MFVLPFVISGIIFTATAVTICRIVVKIVLREIYRITHELNFIIRPFPTSHSDTRVRIYMIHGLAETFHQFVPLIRMICNKPFSADIVFLNYDSINIASIDKAVYELKKFVEPPRHSKQHTVFLGVSLGGVIAKKLAYMHTVSYPDNKSNTACVTIASPCGGMKLVNYPIVHELVRCIRGNLAAGLGNARNMCYIHRLKDIRIPHLAIVATPTWFRGPYSLFHGKDDGLVPVESQHVGATHTVFIHATHWNITTHPETVRHIRQLFYELMKNNNMHDVLDQVSNNMNIQ